MNADVTVTYPADYFHPKAILAVIDILDGDYKAAAAKLGNCKCKDLAARAAKDIEFAQYK